MSIDYIVHRCECKKPIYAVDGDSDTVFCQRCGGILGGVDEVTVDENGVPTIIKDDRVIRAKMWLEELGVPF